MSRMDRIGPMIFVVVGMMVCAGAGFLVVDNLVLLATGETVQGVVESSVETSSSSSTSTRGRYSRGATEKARAPRVRYTTPEGYEGTVVGTFWSGDPEWSVGDTMEILYDPRRPGRARIKSFGQLWGGPAGIAIAGLVFAGLGSLGLKFFRRE